MNPSQGGQQENAEFDIVYTVYIINWSVQAKVINTTKL